MSPDQAHGVDLDEVPSRSPGRPTQSAAPELRAICLAAARQTFLERGYSGATIEQIAKRAKASKMTIYRQFGSKEYLFKIVAEDAIANARRKFDTAEWNDSTDYKVALLDIIRRMHSALTDQSYLDVLKLVISEKERFPDVASTMLDHDTSLLQPIQTFLDKATKKGDLNVPDVRIAASQLTGLASGGIRFLVIDADQSDERRERWVRNVWQFAYNSWRPDMDQIVDPD